MILESALLSIKPGQTGAFEQAFGEAQRLIASMPGYLSHELHRCLELENTYFLLVRWENLEAHTVGFRQSPEYTTWRKLLHHFYEPFPQVLHHERVF